MAVIKSLLDRLRDYRGAPIDKGLLTEEISAPQIGAMRSPLGGHPSAGLTPQRLATILREAEYGNPLRYLELAEDMEEKDPHYLGVMGTRKRQVSQLDITVEAADDSPEAEAHAVLVRAWLRREGLEDELFDILDAVGKGFSVSEIIWDMSERQWSPQSIQYRDPRFFEMDRVNYATPYLRTENGPQALAPYKFITHLHKAKSGLPIRGGLARALSWIYLFKNYDIAGWVQFAEVFGQPLRLGKFHPTADEDDRRKLLQAVSSIGRDAAAIIPESMQMEFVEAKVSGNITLFKEMANYFDGQTSKAVLGQTMTTDDGSSNSQAQVHNEVRGDIEQADAKQLAATLNRDLVRPFIDLNYGPQKAHPRISIGRPEGVDIGEFTKAVERMAKSGLRISAKEVRTKIGVKEPEDGEEILVPIGSAASPPQDDTAEARALAAAEPTKPEPVTPDSLADLVEDDIFGDEWQAAGEAFEAPIHDLLADADSLEDVRAKLPEVIAAMDADRLAELLARGLFAARLAGELDAPTQDGEDDA